MRVVKRGIILLVLLVVGIIFFHYDLVMYGLSQAKGQLQIIWHARPVHEVLNDPDFPDSLKVNLRLIDDIKSFAFDSLGINHSKNYSTVYDQQGHELMFVVTACQPFMLEPKEWSFPFLGAFSYKGFFDEQKAIQLENKLKEEGLDTNIRTAGGWSTLGWFKDPILSNMLADSEADFAETIIHELTHGTLFVKDSLRFNENLATFIGIKGAERYLRNKYGDGSEQLEKYRNTWSDRHVLSRHILNGAMYLDSLYRNMNTQLDENTKRDMKETAIAQIIQSVDTLPLTYKNRYIAYYLKNPPNNTFFMSYLRYRGDIELLQAELDTEYNGDIKSMLQEYKNRYSSL